MRLLMLDIETQPNLVYCWDLFQQNINIEQIVAPSRVLCFSAKWLGDKDTMFYSAKNHGTNTMIRAAHKLLNEADAVVTYNGNSFDIPILNREFLSLGLPPPAPSTSIDLYRVIQSKFKMVSNKLAFVGPYLKIGEKVKHAGFELWLGCLRGDKESWATMEKYNRQDTALMEPLYKRLLPWIDRHPNVNMYDPDIDINELRCPSCGSDRIKRSGLRRGATYTYQRYACLVCNKWFKATKSLKSHGKPPVTGI